MRAELFVLIIASAGFLNQGQAAICPDPNTSSLSWGEIPAPWKINPFSANTPQGETDTKFVRANIMVAGLGRGIVCTYYNSLGEYSIWWETLVKIPARTDYNWIDTLGGYVCAKSLEICEFSTPQS